MKNTNTEKNNKGQNVLKEALLEYSEIVNAAKGLVVENNSKELNSIIDKLLKESETKKEPAKVNEVESAKDNIQESTSIQSPLGENAPTTVDMKQASLAEVEAAFDKARPQDSFEVVRTEVPAGGQATDSPDNFDLTSIEGEIDQMMQEINQAEQMQAQPQQTAQAPVATSAVAPAPAEANNVDRFKQIHEEMGKYLKEIEEMNANQNLMNEFHSKMSEMYGDSYKAQMEEGKIAEQFELYKKNKSGVKPAEASAPVANETAAPVVDEQHGVSLSNNKQVGANEQPRDRVYADHKLRLALQTESINKKMAALLKENLSLTKKLNANKASINEGVVKINESKSLNEKYKADFAKYKTALEKCKFQLSEMAIFSTNVSYVNNLLLNESLALTTKEKEEIVSNFKKIGSVNESEAYYKKVLKESTDKKPLVESLEDKVTTSVIEPSSKNVIEESMNSGNEHITRIQTLMGLNTKKAIV